MDKRDTVVQTAPPEPNLTQEEMIARAKALAPAVRADAAAAEERGYYSRSAPREIPRRRLLPDFRAASRFGGYEFDFPTYYRVMLAKSAPPIPASAGAWRSGSSHALHVASYFPPAAQEKIFGPTRDFIAPGSIPARAKPQCIAKPDGDGYRISGKWPYASGSPYSSHLLGGVQVERRSGPADDDRDAARPVRGARGLGRDSRPQGQRLQHHRGQGRLDSARIRVADGAVPTQRRRHAGLALPRQRALCRAIHGLCRRLARVLAKSAPPRPRWRSTSASSAARARITGRT